MEKWIPKITSQAYTKLKTMYSLAGEKEIGGFLRVEDYEDGDFIVTDAILLKQEVSGGDFEVEDDAIQDFMTELIESGREDELIEFCGWFHQHPCMGWSTTDDETFERYLDNNNGFMLGVVKQSNGILRWRLDRARVRMEKGERIIDKVLTIETEKFEIVYEDEELEQELKEKIDKLLSDRVKEKDFNLLKDEDDKDKKDPIDDFDDAMEEEKKEGLEGKGFFDDFKEESDIDKELKKVDTNDLNVEQPPEYKFEKEKSTEETLLEKGFVKDSRDAVWKPKESVPQVYRRNC